MRKLPTLSRDVKQASLAALREIGACVTGEEIEELDVRRGKPGWMMAAKTYEKELQRTCENWLRAMGYYPRTPAFIRGEAPPRGWYIHLHEARTNPILLDLLILSNDGRYLEVELKSMLGSASEEQAALAAGQNGELVRDFESFAAVVHRWENRGHVAL